MCSVHTKTKGQRFQNLSGLTSGFENEAPFSWRISVDDTPNRRNKAAFLNFSSVE